MCFEGNGVATQKRTAKGRFAAPDEDAEQKSPPKKKKAKTKNCKRYAKERVTEEWPEIVKKLVTKAKTGSYNHTKLLVEVSGIKDEEIQRARRGGSAMTKLLMKRLSEKEVEHETPRGSAPKSKQGR